MKSNKGFSLVELVIVIAIMAILVGLMAPNLVRYIEKTKVSHDVQFADSIKRAVELAMSDPDVFNSESYVRPVSNEMGVCVAYAGDAFSDAVYETLGLSSYAEVLGNLRSKDCTAIMIQIDPDTDKVSVQINGSHADAMGGLSPIIVK